MPKILIFKETVLPPSETFILAQMNALRSFEATLIGLGRTNPSLPLSQPPLLLSQRGPLVSSISAKIYRRSGIAPIFHHHARTLAADLVHAHFASGGRSALALARSLKLPLLVTLHGSDVTVRPFRKMDYQALWSEASVFICVSRYIYTKALEAGFPPEKLHLHYIGIDCQRFSSGSIRPTKRRVLFVGRLVEKKGCEYLIRAMRHVQDQYPQADLEVIGDGPLGKSLIALSAELNVRCHFSGTRSTDYVHRALSTASVFCVPSVTATNGDSEGLGMVFAEAQAMGVPVVSTVHGGIPEIVIDGETGWLVPERDHVSLAASITQLLEDVTAWQSFSDAAKLHVTEHFDLRRQTAELEQLYLSVLQNHPTGRASESTAKEDAGHDPGRLKSLATGRLC